MRSRGLDGIEYAVPGEAERDARFAKVTADAERARRAGAEVVVVQGLGYVGSVMAAVVANARQSDGRPRFFVVGVDLPTREAYWKVAMLAAGRAPVVSEDPDVETYCRRGVLEAANLAAVADDRAYALADVVIVDVQLDAAARVYDKADEVEVRMEPFREAIRTIGRMVHPDALVLLETTVPPGTTSRVVIPVLREEFARRGVAREPLVAHSYERVMPGRHYVRSIERFWRTFSGHTPEAGDRAERFLRAVIDTREHPLRRLAQTEASELAKVMENSYRAANIAFVHEWTLAAERLGVNLYEVIDSIAVRRGTHDNLMKPGFGVGGYCLTKDPYLAQFGLREICGVDVPLSVSLSAMRTNFAMPAHTLDLLVEAAGDLAGEVVVVAGVSYRPDVADTRHSPTEAFCDALLALGATPLVHDPYVRVWPERPAIAVAGNLATALAGARAVVFAQRHAAYLALDARTLPCAPGTVVVDAADVLTDEKAAVLRERGMILRGVGKGHWSRAAGGGDAA
jgi:nucleotide sugar dehydrogenase